MFTTVTAAEPAGGWGWQGAEAALGCTPGAAPAGPGPALGLLHL